MPSPATCSGQRRFHAEALNAALPEILTPDYLRAQSLERDRDGV